MSVVYVGAYSWSRSYNSTEILTANSHSTCGATNASVVTVHISDSNCYYSSTSTIGSSNTSDSISYGVNAYGGSISAAYIGAYAFSFALKNKSNTKVETTHVETLSITIKNVTINGSKARSCEYC